MFRPLVPDPKLNQQGSRGGLEVKAALQHCRLRAGGFGWEVNNHQTLKLLQKLLWHGVARSLGLLPRHLEPVKSLVHLHHLLVESAQVRGHTHTEQYCLLLTNDMWGKDSTVHSLGICETGTSSLWTLCCRLLESTCGSLGAGWAAWGWGFQSGGCRTALTPPAAEGGRGSDRFPCRDLVQDIGDHAVMER